MKHQSLILCLFFLLFMKLTGMRAQESVNAGCNNISSSDGTISYSIGQFANSIHTGADGELSEGVQHPYEITITTEVKEFLNIKTKVYPNPTSDILTLQIETNDMENYSYKIFDINGRQLQKSKITDVQTQINMSGLVSATYFITILQNNEKINSFQIIKK
ncbi:T9SS type A sorting domain-containing protein [Saccharicrinis fermentans]|uniref:Secretion system C-terminal sorting domain-containing protein n=1 Tax=Saccharicrinis fermentans DSM 9555 = JCM 21142 TaxID=869213 RepID=W7YJG5_9BACT|nr:T9SS type A sorting domain-containing protein [Saccharicrinis fermentans]GAF04651.1 hypothetical protein JCM21142_93363 [Saccharicrinis fermentans DSM 9555 = JCM 21142]